MRQRLARVLVGVLGAAVSCSAAVALTAREILDKTKALEDTSRHWVDRAQRMTLKIYSAGSDERRREIVAYTKRYPGDEEKTISFILVGAEVKGVGFLQWTHKSREAEQWLYLPELRRTRQISARLRDESFVGTDFTYRELEILEDVLRWSEDEASAKLLGDESIGGIACAMIELRPKQAGIPYQGMVLWMDRDKLVPRKFDFSDREGAHVKTLTLDDVRDLATIPTPHRLEMQNLKKGSHTVVELTEVTYNVGLSDELFTQRQLERGAP